MTPCEMIARRRSVRKYTDTPMATAIKQSILDHLESMRPLFPELSVYAEFLGREAVKATLPMPWAPPDLLAVYAEDTIPSRMNVGYLLSLLDLSLQGAGLGTCWLGLAKPKDGKERRGLPFMIMMAIGYPSDTPLRSGAKDFTRHALSEIADRADERLEPARLAPSAINGQPWYFTHTPDGYNLYCAHKKSATLRGLAHIDVGIALGHLAAANPETFSCFGARILRALPGYEYMLSFSI